MKKRLQIERSDSIAPPRRKKHKARRPDGHIEMDNWQRIGGKTWVRSLNRFHAQVNLGTGGWYWIVLDSKGGVRATGGQPAYRSRQARKQAQRALMALASFEQQQVQPRRLFRLKKAA